MESSHHISNAKVTPIKKKGNSLLTEKNCPIEIMPILSEVHETLVLKRRLAFMNALNFIYPQQFGFGKSKSTIGAITALVESVLEL